MDLFRVKVTNVPINEPVTLNGVYVVTSIVWDELATTRFILWGNLGKPARVTELDCTFVDVVTIQPKELFIRSEDLPK